jgi:hypothetical protein
VRNLKDMFTASSHILQTITRDPTTERVRSIKPNEEAVSMWDRLDTTARAFAWDPNAPNEPEDREEGFMTSYAYTEADEIEDALLFPYEANGDMADNLFRNDPSAMEVFEKETIDVRKFVNDVDTDEEEGEFDEEFDSEEDYDFEMDDEALDALEDDDGNSEWDTDEESNFGGAANTFITAEEHDAIDQTVDELAADMKKVKMREPDYFLPVVQNAPGARKIPELVKKDPSNLMHACRNALRCLKEYDRSRMGIESDFFRHLDRQKSKGMYF